MSKQVVGIPSRSPCLPCYRADSHDQSDRHSKVPGIRAFAAEALATLHQPEDVSRLAALLTDGAEATMELQAPVYGQQVRPFQVGPAPDAVTGHTWRNSSVASHAAWGLYLMLFDT
jgi:hypothetical protein